MNPELPKNPHDEMEARITALLLGELSAYESESVREAIAKDPALTKLHDDLKRTIHLVRESVQNSAAEKTTPADQPKLSDERREKLLAQFKTIKPTEFARTKPSRRISVGFLVAMVAIMGLLAALLFPVVGGLPKARSTSASNAIINNLRQLDAAKQQWALDNNKPAKASPTFEEIKPYLGRGAAQEVMPPVAGEKYVLGKVGEPAYAEFDAKQANRISRTPAKQFASIAPDQRVRLSDEGKWSVAKESNAGTLAFRTWSGDVADRPPMEVSPPPQGGVYSANVRGYYDGNGKSMDTEKEKHSPVGVAGIPAATPAPQIVLPNTGVPIEAPIAAGSYGFGLHVASDEDRGGGNRALSLADTPSAGYLFKGASETPQQDRAAGFDWYLGNKLKGGAAVATQAGTAPAADETRSISSVGAEPGENRVPKDDSAFGGRELQMAQSQTKPMSGFSLLGPTELSGKNDSVVNIENHWSDETMVRNSEPGKTIPRPTNIPKVEPGLKTEKPLTEREAVQTLDGTSASNDFSIINMGDKYAKVIPTTEASQEGSPRTLSDSSDSLNRKPSTSVQAQESYVTQIVQLKNVNPTEMVSVIKPFAKMNDIIASDTNGTLVIRDHPENVSRMMKMIQQMDVSVPSEFISYVIPIRHAKVDYVSSVLNDLPIGPESTLETHLRNPAKIISDERSKSLLVFATSDDIETIKRVVAKLDIEQAGKPLPKSVPNAPVPQPEILCRENNFSTFSLNVSDVSFKLAAASLEKGQMPDAASIRSEEFINAFDYRDAEATANSPVAFAWERARYPFAHNRDLLRFSIKTAAIGRQAGRPLNLVLLLDNSGSMERADRVRIIREALRVLAKQLQPQDKLSVITFARTAHLRVDGAPGNEVAAVAMALSELTPEGGTNLEDAMNLAYQTASRHFIAGGINRVVLLTDGAANLGDIAPDSLKQKVESFRKQGVALDCFGIGWEGFNDDLLEVLSRNGDGRYGFINSPEEAATEFAGQLAGALKVAASDVKVQVEFNPRRVTSYRQIGYAKHQLTKEQFRDNTVDAAEIAAQEAGNALYTIETNPGGDGPICTVRVRYKIPGASDYREQSWDVPYTGNAVALEQSSPAMRLAASASAFSEWLATSPFASEISPDQLLNLLRGVPETYGADPRPKKLEWMIRQAKSIEGK